MNVSNKDLIESKKVVSKYELIGIILLFFIIFVVLFPKGKLEGYVLSENKNYELSIKYLETLSKLNSENKFFKLALLKFYIKSGQLEKAENLVRRCEKNVECIWNITFLKYAYNVYKNLYFQISNKKYLLNAEKYLWLIVKSSSNRKDYLYVYNETYLMNFTNLRYKVLKILSKDTKNKKYLYELLELSLYYKDFNTSIKTINTLYNIDRDINLLEKKAEIYAFAKKDIDKAVKIYTFLFEKVKNNKLKTKYFLNAFYLFVWNKKNKKALNLAKKYEDYFIFTNNKTVIKKLIAFYLQTGNLKMARELSLKAFKVMH